MSSSCSLKYHRRCLPYCCLYLSHVNLVRTGYKVFWKKMGECWLDKMKLSSRTLQFCQNFQGKVIKCLISWKKTKSGFFTSTVSGIIDYIMPTYIWKMVYKWQKNRIITKSSEVLWQNGLKCILSSPMIKRIANFVQKRMKLFLSVELDKSS